MLEPLALLNTISFLYLLLFLIVASDLDFICHANQQVQPKTKPCFRSCTSLTRPPVIPIMLRLSNFSLSEYDYLIGCRARLIGRCIMTIPTLSACRLCTWQQLKALWNLFHLHLSRARILMHQGRESKNPLSLSQHSHRPFTSLYREHL
ncbi:hypothetical protein EDB82DRAFT_184339 [Fusarium venenatum]|uniref:uncharacterized protein n=1 Tax=Fusarium venenatum TaxID=56646 RepID=UPI001D1CEA17|nr:hypothetical protein EDB82DRAFT_184339 [Fusarium venenatum]